MNVKISPTSGYDNSYYDIKFIVTFDNELSSSDFKLSFLNKTTDTLLDILATSQGTIENGTHIIGKPCKQIVGYFNLFNDDKMNVGLSRFNKIELECIAENENEEFRKRIFFFNESFSSDGEIIPFEIEMKNKTIDLSKNEPLEFDVIADFERSFHMVVESTLGNLSYDFYIFTKKGRMTIRFPIEILHYELSLYKTSKQTFRLSYMKEHGVTYNNVVNKKKVSIRDSEIKFINSFRLFPQTRFDSLDRELSYKDFFPSDRYYVPTWKEFTFFSKIVTNRKKSSHRKNFKDELLNINSDKDQGRILSWINERFWRREEERPIKNVENSEHHFYNTMTRIYNQKSIGSTSMNQKIKQSVNIANLNGIQARGDSGCADCARKKRKRNSEV